MQQRPLKILAIGYSTSTHVANRVRCFADRGHDVTILSEAPAEIPGVKVVTPAAPADRYPWITSAGQKAGKLTGKNFSATTDMARLLLDYRRLVMESGADVVHVHYAYSTWGWMAAVLGLKPLVVSIMGGDVLFEEQGSPTPRGIALTKRLLGAADLITAKSNFLIGVLDQLGGFGHKATRVVWGVDPAVFRPQDGGLLRQELGIAGDAKVVLSPKIMSPFYNIHLLVEAMAEVARRQPKASLVITEYGADPAYRRQLENRIAELGIAAQVKFVGRIPHDKMPAYYNIADVAVGIPASDGLPQTLLEAMACGVPNIVGPLDRYSEIVRNGESALFAELTPGSVAQAILRVLEDPSLKDRLSSQGRDIVVAEANFPADVARVEAAYYKLARNTRRRTLPNPAMLKDVGLYWLGR